MSNKKTLTLQLKREYFEAIKAGEKTEEFRIASDYWRRRIVGKDFDKIVLTLGYPKDGDESKRIRLPWRGYRVTRITHEQFGPGPVEVYAIALAVNCGAHT